MANLSDAYRHLMDAAASTREAREALDDTHERRQLASIIDRLDDMAERVEATLKAGA